jgi:hypothetical protein
MSEQLALIEPPNMTEIERLIYTRRAAFAERHHQELSQWEAQAKAEIARQVESANRSLGQLFRYARARLEAKFRAHEQAPKLGSEEAVGYCLREVVRSLLKERVRP